MSTGGREDYLINILRLAEGEGVVRTSKLASFMKVAPASVTEMLHTLSDAGLVNYEKYRGVSLTPKGMECAQNLRRKHHIVERFLTDVLDIDHQAAHDEACLMEHAISDDSANRMCRIIGTRVDCDCGTCNNPCNSHKCEYTLSDLSSGDVGIISHLKSNDLSKVKKLLSMGFIPGREVVLESKQINGPRVVRIGDSIFALDTDLASTVCLEDDSNGQ